MPNAELTPLSLHDALPISLVHAREHLRAAESVRVVERRVGCSGIVNEDAGGERNGRRGSARAPRGHRPGAVRGGQRDRKSTRLNSSHGYSSYAVFCLKKKT